MNQGNETNTVWHHFQFKGEPTSFIPDVDNPGLGLDWNASTSQAKTG
jgi:hypothetical protein